jgi:hypothetical protein
MSSRAVAQLARSPHLAVLQVQNIAPASPKSQNLPQGRLLCIFVTD